MSSNNMSVKISIDNSSHPSSEVHQCASQTKTSVLFSLLYSTAVENDFAKPINIHGYTHFFFNSIEMLNRSHTLSAEV